MRMAAKHAACGFASDAPPARGHRTRAWRLRPRPRSRVRAARPVPRPRQRHRRRPRALQNRLRQRRHRRPPTLLLTLSWQPTPRLPPIRRTRSPRPRRRKLKRHRQSLSRRRPLPLLLLGACGYTSTYDQQRCLLIIAPPFLCSAHHARHSRVIAAAVPQLQGAARGRVGGARGRRGWEGVLSPMFASGSHPATSS